MPKSRVVKKKSSLLKKTKFLALAGMALGTANVKAMDKDDGAQGGARGGYTRSSQQTSCVINMVELAKGRKGKPQSVSDLSNATHITLDFTDLNRPGGGWVKQIKDDFSKFSVCTELTIKGFNAVTLGDAANSKLLNVGVRQKAPQLEVLNILDHKQAIQLSDLHQLGELRKLRAVTGTGLTQQELERVIPELKRNNRADEGYAGGYRSSPSPERRGSYASDTDQEEDFPAPSSTPHAASPAAPGQAQYNVLVSQKVKADGLLRASFSEQKDWDFSCLAELEKDFSTAVKNGKPATTFKLLSCENLTKNPDFLWNVMSKIPAGIMEIYLDESDLGPDSVDFNGDWVRQVKMRIGSTLEVLNCEGVPMFAGGIYELGYDPASKGYTGQPVFQNLTSLNLKNTGIGDDAAESLGWVIARNPLESMTLANNAFTDMGITTMMKSVENTWKEDYKNTHSKRHKTNYSESRDTLEKINLSGNQGITDKAKDRLFYMLAGHDKLTEVDLSGTGMSSGEKKSLQNALRPSCTKALIVK